MVLRFFKDEKWTRQVHGKGALSFSTLYELSDSNLNEKEKFLKAMDKVLTSGAGDGKVYQIKKEPLSLIKIN